MKNKKFAKQYVNQVNFISACHSKINELISQIKWSEDKGYKVALYIPERLKQLKILYKNAQRGLSNLELLYREGKEVKNLPYFTAKDNFAYYYKTYIQTIL